MKISTMTQKMNELMDKFEVFMSKWAEKIF